MARGLRVVAGSAGGLLLVAPKNARPSTDRTKEALFASLGDLVDDAVVLDLYAGSGALGIEALSRGAARAVFVDRDRNAIDAIRTNLATTHLTEHARVQSSAVSTFFHTPPPEAPFDLVLLDPPYDAPVADTADDLLALTADGWLAPSATVVLECRVTARPDLPAAWRVERERAYGDTLLVVATVHDGPSGHDRS
ncbi:MAG: 16S rRNA (guanine(966)-N(2))-methyltransferase RsmD [Acidimicrobiia bacterium]